jgi:hypothetical protein
MLDLGSITTTERPPSREQSPAQDKQTSLSSAELAECACPEPCERDHDRD